MSEQNSKKIFSQLSPKISFFLGIASTLVTVFIIGFFVLLGILLKSNKPPTVAGVSQKAAAVPTIQQPAQPELGDIQLAAITDADYIKGNLEARVSIVEFSDTECPFCKRFHPTMQQIIKEYDGQVNWVYRHFPLASLHSKAPKEAEAVECAGELGGNNGFWSYLDRLFEITPANNELDISQLPEIAEYAGLNRNNFEDCLSSGKFAEKIKQQAQQAQTAGGQGTPFSILVVDGQPITTIPGAYPYEQVKAIIDANL